jgi:RHS repeat-associated protein
LICFSSCIKKCVNHLNNQNNPYLYNGKELDAETGFYYYGARYYDPKSSLWLSVDPLAEKMPDFSAYAYAFNNPVMFVDPTGMEGESIHLDKYGKVLKNIDDGDNSVYVHNDAKIKSDVDKTYSANNPSCSKYVAMRSLQLRIITKKIVFLK